MQLPNVPFLPDAQIRKIAEGYLAEHHPSGALPIPIEDIVEINERITVIPVADLMVDGHEAYTSRDRKTIYIDQNILMRDDPNRRRSTLAHELSHIILHRPVFDAAAAYCDIAQWRKFLASLPDLLVKRVEDQAFALAGHLLVPTNDLLSVYASMAERLKKRTNTDVQNLPPQALSTFAKLMGNEFQVSGKFIHSRAVKEGLWKWEDMPRD